jgi:hypothetical protein
MREVGSLRFKEKLELGVLLTINIFKKPEPEVL